MFLLRLYSRSRSICWEVTVTFILHNYIRAHQSETYKHLMRCNNERSRSTTPLFSVGGLISAAVTLSRSSFSLSRNIWAQSRQLPCRILPLHAIFYIPLIFFIKTNVIIEIWELPTHSQLYIHWLLYLLYWEKPSRQPVVLLALLFTASSSAFPSDSPFVLLVIFVLLAFSSDRLWNRSVFLDLRLIAADSLWINRRRLRGEISILFFLVWSGFNHCVRGMYIGVLVDNFQLLL